MAALGPCCCAWPFPSCDEWGPLFIAVHWASHCRGLSCCRAWALGAWASAVGACGL